MSSLAIPETTRFTDLLNDKSELIDIHRIVQLFQLVTPRLLRVLEDTSREFSIKWEKIKELIYSRDELSRTCRLILGLETIFTTKYQGFLSSINSFQDTSQKFADSLEAQLLSDEKELLVVIFQSKSLIPSTLELLRDVDNLEDDMRSMFAELIEFADDILENLSIFDESLRLLSNV